MLQDAILTLDEAAPSTPHVHLVDILAAVSQVFGVSRTDLISKRRDKTFCDARHVYCWVALKFTTCSLTVIGRHCGDRDHSTISHGALKIDRQFSEFRERIAKVLKALQLDTEVAA